MKILHYALGFPPYRSGGLTKYCVDLMIKQKEEGHEVAMMWPGAFSLTGHFVRLKKSKKTIENTLIDSVEVINPQLVPLDEGILNPEMFIKECVNPETYTEFLKEYKPDTIHIHTLMGLHKEFVEIAKKMGIAIVFSTHDYFGLCPKVTMFKNGKTCDGKCVDCRECNEGALSVNKIKILQSGIYRKLKDSLFIKKIREIHRKKFFEEQTEQEDKDNNLIIKTDEEIYEHRYKNLRDYYVSILKSVNMIHFNSTVTEYVYRKFIPSDIKGKVITISHNNIRDNRRKKEFSGEILKITYLAPAKDFKGYGILIKAMDKMWDEGIKKVHLTMYNESACSRPYLTVKSRFEYSELEKIFDETDVLIMPSVWYETFGFTVLEALSYGVPVIVSENVGAKDLLEKGEFGMIIKPTSEQIRDAVKELVNNRQKLIEFNENIVNKMDMEKTLQSSKSITKLYKNI